MAELVPLESEPLKGNAEDEAESERPMERRDSMMEKLVAFEGRERYISSAKLRVGLCFVAFVAIVAYAGWRQVQEAVSMAVNRGWISDPRGDGAVQLPSLNLFDYEAKASFPVFKSHPKGIERKQMPQLPERTTEDGALVWADFGRAIEQNGGAVCQEDVDLRFTKPLQSEISGLIVYNVLLDGIRARMESNPRLFSEHIILVETPSKMVGRWGENFPAGTLFNLDGHHTNQVLKLCARLQHPNLRRGNMHNDDHICGRGFRTRQNVTVIRGLEPLAVMALALESGADSGHGLVVG